MYDRMRCKKIKGDKLVQVNYRNVMRDPKTSKLYWNNINLHSKVSEKYLRVHLGSCILV